MLKTHSTAQAATRHAGLTVHDLIRWLERMNGDALVVVVGREGGYQPLFHVEDMLLKLNVNGDPAFGPHEHPVAGEKPDCRAVLLVGEHPSFRRPMRPEAD